MKYLELVYKYKEKDYPVHITYGRQRNIYYRFKEGSFYITAPYLTSKNQIQKGLEKFAEKLIQRDIKIHSNYSFEDDYLFILGEKRKLSEFALQNNEDLDKFLKVKSLEVLTYLVRKNEQIMEIEKPYKISVRHTKNQFGSNSKKTHHLSFQIELVHYSMEIIETVVIHELAHEFERNHSKNFYNIVYKYCPNYKELQRKLKRGIHQWL